MYLEDDYESLLIGMTFLILLFSSIIIGIYKIIVRWIVYKKAGKEGFEAIIPFYNGWTFYEISGYPGYYIFFGLIPYVGWIVRFVFVILASISLAKKFKKSEAFGVFLIAFLPAIGLSILAFGKNKYYENKGEQKSTSIAKNIYDNDKDENKLRKSLKVENESTKETLKIGDDYVFCGYCGQQLNKKEKKCTKCGKEL